MAGTCFDDPSGAREEYDHGWPTVLDHFRTAFTDAATWVALAHRPADVLGSAVFDDRRFPDHVAFLREMPPPRSPPPTRASSTACSPSTSGPGM